MVKSGHRFLSPGLWVIFFPFVQNMARWAVWWDRDTAPIVRRLTTTHNTTHTHQNRSAPNPKYGCSSDRLTWSRSSLPKGSFPVPPIERGHRQLVSAWEDQGVSWRQTQLRGRSPQAPFRGQRSPGLSPVTVTASQRLAWKQRVCPGLRPSLLPPLPRPQPACPAACLAQCVTEAHVLLPVTPIAATRDSVHWKGKQALLRRPATRGEG